jgi:N-acetylmuramoyl-L-alanine amidase
VNPFTATYADIEFPYTTSVSGTPDMSSNPLFKSAEWIEGSNSKYILRLHLRKAATFYGYSVAWDDNNNITFTFNNPPSIVSGSKPLAGKKIVIDPGHGGSHSGAVHKKLNGTQIYEKNLNIDYAYMLRDKLTSLGATVVLTRTGDTLPDNAWSPPRMYARTDFARNNNTDLFISIHMDSIGNNSQARGFTVFYFNEFSKAFGEAMNDSLEPAYRRLSGGKKGRGVRWNYFTVMNLHDCPALLLECGFMSNPDELELLMSSEYKDGFTQAMVEGIISYLNTSNIEVNPSTTTQSTPQTTATVAAAIVPAELIAFARGRKKRRPVR